MTQISTSAKAGAALLATGAIADKAQPNTTVETSPTVGHHAKVGYIKPAPGDDPRFAPGTKLDLKELTFPTSAEAQDPGKGKEKTVGDVKKERAAKKVDLEKTVETENGKLDVLRGKGIAANDKTVTQAGIDKFLTTKATLDDSKAELLKTHQILKTCRVPGANPTMGFTGKGGAATNKEQDALQLKWAAQMKQVNGPNTDAFEAAQKGLDALPDQDAVAATRRSVDKIDDSKKKLAEIAKEEADEAAPKKK